MILYKGLALILLLPLPRGSSSYPLSCPTEVSTFQIDEELFSVTWKTRQRLNVSLVISDPPCLDKNDKLSYRICSNGTWIYKTSCHNLDFNSACPTTFYEDNDKCIYVTPPQPFEKKCPYPGASTKIKDYRDIWLPIKQLVPFSAYEYILPDEKYGLDFSPTDSSESSDEIIELQSSGCVVKTNKIETVPCNSNYSHVCSYKSSSFSYRCPNDCVGGGLGSNYCFCKKKFKQGSTKNVCKRLATPNYTYERNIIYKLVGSDTCLLGYSQFRNFHIVISNKNLHLKHIEEVNCAMCVVNPIKFDNVEMNLKFNVKNRKLFLELYSPEGLFSIDDKVQVFCFTDATNQLKKRVEIELEFDSRKKNSENIGFMVFKVSISEDGPGLYWCEAFLLPNVTIIQSNKVLAYKNFNSNEYSLQLKIHNICKFSLIYCKMPDEQFIRDVSKTLFKHPALSKFIKNVRLFRIYHVNYTTETVDVLVHISVKTKLLLEEEYGMIQTNLKYLLNQNVTVISFLSSTYCLSENFSVQHSLHWPLTLVGAATTPQEICLTEFGIPVVRKCKGNFLLGASWETLSETCHSNYSISNRTSFLHSMLFSNKTLDLSYQNITTITANSSDFTVLDVHYVSQVLRQLLDVSRTNTNYFGEIGETFNNLMFSNTSVLNKSQALLNSTDELINTLENFLEFGAVENDTLLLIYSNLIIHVTKPFINNVSGIAVYEGDGSGFLSSSIKQLFSNTSIHSFENDASLDLAVYIPENLLNSLAANVSSTNLPNITVITTIYHKNNLFNSDNGMNNTIVSKVVSVSIPGYGDYLSETIPILFKSNNNFSNQSCVFWNYGLQSENHTGYWSTLGGEIKKFNTTRLCLFSHLTNFALLLKINQNVNVKDQNKISQIVVDKYDIDVLDIVSNVGCTISVFGIIGIFITAVVFKSWREKVGTRILMQMCVAILLQIIFLNLATVTVAKFTSQAFCTTVGIILHYVTVAEFAWMLVAAILQFYRFVRVVGPMPNRIILKAMFLGWGLPIIPVVLTCAVNIKTYSKGTEGLCYPAGIPLYTAVFLPIVLIILINLTVFIVVILNIFKLKVESQGGSQNVFKNQVYLSILLFFLLGLPWIFGLVAGVVTNSAISYIFLTIFCFTATLQGFVLFIFYVVLDKATRTLWYNYYKKADVS